MAYDVVLLIVVPAIMVIAATILAGRRKRAKSGDLDGDSLSFVGGVLNALFTVVLAFFVVFAWEKADGIGDHATAEADALMDAYWQVSVAPQQDATRIRVLLKDYAVQVADREWPALDEGVTNPRVTKIINELRVAVTNLPADAEPVASARAQALQDVRDINENHRERVNESTGTDKFTIALLAGTLLGAVLMLVFPLVMGLSSRTSNLVAMVLLTVTLGCTLYVSLKLLHPLHGFFGTDPEVFRNVIEEMSAAPSGEDAAPPG